MRISLVEWFIGLSIILGLLLFLTQPYFEAQTYNKLTGANVSTWDAIWVELRVEGNTK